MKNRFEKTVAAIALGVAATVSTSAASFADDIADGENVFKKCKACHSVEAGVNKVGPTLFGVVDRPAATVPDYNYSPAMVQAGADGIVWDAATLDTYLTKPKDLVPKTKMAFAGLKKAEDREHLIAYLETLHE